MKRERHERTGTGEEAGKGKESSGACRLEIIGVRISGQSVIFTVDAVLQRVVGRIPSNRCSAFHRSRAGGS